VIDDQFAEAQVRYRWLNAAGRTLIEFPFGVPSHSTFHYGTMFYQPVFEDTLYEAVDRTHAEVFMGWEVTGLEQQADHVLVTARKRTRDQEGLPVVTDETKTVRASYVIAADGAGSKTRERLNIAREDLGFSEQWLVVDTRVTQPELDDWRQHRIASQVSMVCDPHRPGMSTPLGKRHHRWEFMLLPGETIEDFERPEKAWELLGGSRADLPAWPVTKEHVEIVRQVVYRFEGKLAETFRDGRIFLAGDAAHSMPPHMGQGMCAGMRDVSNLAWKLSLVLTGVAAEGLLDTYEVERKPHARAYIEMSIAVGKISCILDADAAAERDVLMLRGIPPEIPLMPQILGGVVDLDEYNTPIAPAGQVFLQCEVETARGRGLFHDLLGHGFMIVSSTGDPCKVLDEKRRAALASIGARYAWLAETPGSDGAFVDVEGRYGKYMDGREAIIVRPDYQVFGAVRSIADLPLMVDNLMVALSYAGNSASRSI
jgi:2-polyprenyl-6-methoxyphenol hydroxylase-like FAD-dependent oxidoreductase